MMGLEGQRIISICCCSMRSHRRGPLFSHLLPLFCLALCCGSGLIIRTAEGYKNYTVGDDLGWFDKLEKPKVDYQKWADAKNFSLGDFLIFNTDRNHTLVQTYNATTYKTCSYDDSLDTDTQLWSAGGPPSFDTTPVTLEVPLVREGATYFFSGDYDGEQCRNGQRFQIDVAHGQGLPPSLRTPDSTAAPSPAAGDADGSAPDTDVQENFDHPKQVQATKGSDSSGAAAGAAARIGRTGVLLVGLAVLRTAAVGLLG